MKVDLTARDIELLVMLLAQSAAENMSYKPSLVYSIEEIALIDKLESALRKLSIPQVDILDTDSNGLCH